MSNTKPRPLGRRQQRVWDHLKRGGMTAGQAAYDLKMSCAVVSRIMDALEKRGLIDANNDPIEDKK